MKQHTCDHSLCDERRAKHEEYRDRFSAGIDKLLEPHVPEPEQWGLRPGNSHRRIQFYCQLCRIPWPCRVFNDLRALYGEVNDWPPATIPYEPLVLRRENEPGVTSSAPDTHPDPSHAIESTPTQET